MSEPHDLSDLKTLVHTLVETVRRLAPSPAQLTLLAPPPPRVPRQQVPCPTCGQATLLDHHHQARTHRQAAPAGAGGRRCQQCAQPALPKRNVCRKHFNDRTRELRRRRRDPVNGLRRCCECEAYAKPGFIRCHVHLVQLAARRAAVQDAQGREGA